MPPWNVRLKARCLVLLAFLLAAATLQHEELGRILFYNPPVSFEHDLAAQQHP